MQDSQLGRNGVLHREVLLYTGQPAVSLAHPTHWLLLIYTWPLAMCDDVISQTDLSQYNSLNHYQQTSEHEQPRIRIKLCTVWTAGHAHPPHPPTSPYGTYIRASTMGPPCHTHKCFTPATPMFKDLLLMLARVSSLRARGPTTPYHPLGSPFMRVLPPHSSGRVQ